MSTTPVTRPGTGRASPGRGTGTGTGKVDAALGLAAIAGRFADGDLASIIDHLAAERQIGEVVIADEAHSAQPGTSGWASLGTGEAGR
jgi:hypothetical protein